MNILKNIVKMLGKKGGQKSAEVRLGHLTDEEISVEMRKIRYSKEQIKKMDQHGKEFVENLNRNVLVENQNTLGHLTEEEKSKEMRRIRLYNQRYTPEEQKEMDEMGKEFVENLNKNVREENEK